jgi:hypothetical protein
MNRYAVYVLILAVAVFPIGIEAQNVRVATDVRAEPVLEQSAGAGVTIELRDGSRLPALPPGSPRSHLRSTDDPSPTRRSRRFWIRRPGHPSRLFTDQRRRGRCARWHASTRRRSMSLWPLPWLSF